MIRGLYTGAAGMEAMQAQQDVLANNLANMNTAGFKEDLAVFRSRQQMGLMRIQQVGPDGGTSTAAITGGAAQLEAPYVGSLGTGVYLDEISTRYHVQGALRQTDNPLDLGLQGDGYFAVRRGQDLLFTRDGHFNMSADGHLVDNDGNPVLGTNGQPIFLGTQGKPQISEDGTVSNDGQVLGKIQLVTFANPDQALLKQGDNLLAARPGYAPANSAAKVHQGFLEQSTVNPVREMVEMITAMRNYEANSKTVQAEDETLGQANQIGHP